MSSGKMGQVILVLSGVITFLLICMLRMWLGNISVVSELESDLYDSKSTISDMAITVDELKQDIVEKDSIITDLQSSTEEISQDLDTSDVSVTYEQIVKDAEDFKSSCTSVSWEELRRSPETYNGSNISVNVQFTTVEPDGLIFQGDLIGSMDADMSSPVCMYDSRLGREPRFLEGDYITIYCKAGGLAELKEKLSVFTVDSYEVPMLEIMYTDLDNYADWYKCISEDSADSHY